MLADDDLGLIWCVITVEGCTYYIAAAKIERPAIAQHASIQPNANSPKTGSTGVGFLRFLESDHTTLIVSSHPNITVKLLNC